MALIRRNPSSPRFLSAIVALLCLSSCLTARAQDDDARATMIIQIQQKLAKAQAAHDFNEQGSDLLLLGRLHSVSGEERQAMDAFTQALSIFRFRGDRIDEARALSGLAKVYARLGHKQLALEDFNKALQIQQQIGDTAGQALTLQNIAALRDTPSLTSELGKNQPSDQASQASSSNRSPSGSFDSPGQPGLPATSPQAQLQSAESGSSLPDAASAQPESQSQSAPDSMPPAQSEVQEVVPPQPPNPPQPDQSAGASDQDDHVRKPKGKPPGDTSDSPNRSLRMPTPTAGVDYPSVGSQAPSSSANSDRPLSDAQLAVGALPQSDLASGDTPLKNGRDWTGTDPTDRDSKAPAEPASNLPPVERYPTIEAPDTVSVSQEIAVQFSLTSDQISPETKILSGNQNHGKLQLHMANGERQWTLTVNITAPGMEITRNGSNTAQITIDRDGDSTIAAFYMRALPLTAANADGKRDTRIFATLWHNNAFLARIVRPLSIFGAASQPTPAPLAPAAAPAPPAPMAQARVSASNIARPTAAAPSPPHSDSTQVSLDPATIPPDLTIVENRVGDILRLVFFAAGSSAPVEADIPNPDQLHQWINNHFAQMASHSRAITPEPPTPAQAQIDQLHASDHLNAFGAELYDRFAPPAFKTLYSDLLSSRTSDNPLVLPNMSPIAIQIFSDDPSLPWELMRPTSQDGSRMDFLGVTDSIARWPLSRRGSSRPPQSLTVQNSVVVAPTYRGAQTLTAANQELTTLKSIRGFTQVAGDYQSVRNLAGRPPQGIVHFAGHGQVSEENGVPRFTILLEDSEIDPATWQALGSAAGATHPLFFFNACDVGESRQFMNEVDGWAPALLGNGASGYIGALWPVKDSTAALFASTFYAFLDKSLATGHYLNVASLLAHTRAQVFRETGDATALAYVFYGDPKLVLAAPTARQ